MTQSPIDLVIEVIRRQYNADECGYTSECSRGNSDDVFEDGYDAGYSNALFKIGTMLGLDLPEPEEPEE